VYCMCVLYVTAYCVSAYHMHMNLLYVCILCL